MQMLVTTALGAALIMNGGACANAAAHGERVEANCEALSRAAQETFRVVVAVNRMCWNDADCGAAETPCPFGGETAVNKTRVGAVGEFGRGLLEDLYAVGCLCLYERGPSPEVPCIDGSCVKTWDRGDH